MLRIFAAFTASLSDGQPRRIKTTGWEYLYRCSNILCWGACGGLALLLGYYGHIWWNIHFVKEEPSTVTAVPAPDYVVSDTHYIFKKRPLPANEVPVLPVEPQFDIENAPKLEPISNNQSVSDSQDYDSLKLRVSQALEEMQKEAASKEP